YIDRQATFSIFPILRKELGFSSSQLGLTGTVFTWVYALCMPLAGYIADAMRRDRLVIASVALWSAATLGTALSHSPASFLGWWESSQADGSAAGRPSTWVGERDSGSSG